MRQPKSSAQVSLQASVDVSREEIDAVLAKEKRPAIRKRLRALKLLLSGQSVSATARRLKVDPSSVQRWWKTTRTSKLAAILIDGRRAKPPLPLSPETVSEALSEIARAMKRRPHWRLRKKLEALDLALRGKLEEGAALAHVLQSTVESWLHAIRREGISAYLQKSEVRSYAPRLDIDAAALREMAAKEWNPRIRKRMLAVAYVAEGMGYYDAGVAAGLNHPAVKRWVDRVKKSGPSVLE